MPESKTNVMRILDKERIPYLPHAYESSDGQIDGVSVAHKLGLPPEKVFKTLVTKGHSGGYAVFVLPVHRELDLKKAAKAAGEKSVSMIPVKDITGVTGYIRGGCSPVGMKKRYPTVVDSSAAGQESILVSAGKIGSQVELNPATLSGLLNASFADIQVQG